MYKERIKVIIRQADPCNKTGDATKGVGVAKEFLAIRRAISLNETFVLFC